MDYPDVLVVEVTQEDIDLGVTEDPEYCPIARSLKRQGFKHVNVGFPYEESTGDILISKDSILRKDAATYFHSTDSYEFVKDFDDYKKVNPTVFFLTKRQGAQ